MKNFISKWISLLPQESAEGDGQLLRSYEHTEGPKMNYQNRNHLTLLVTEITSWLEPETKT